MSRLLDRIARAAFLAPDWVGEMIGTAVIALIMLAIVVGIARELHSWNW